MKKKITVISCVIFVAAMMMFAQPAMSGKWGGTPGGEDLEILLTTVEPGYQGEFEVVFYIVGKNFDNGATPVATFAGQPAVVIDGPNPAWILEDGTQLWFLVVGFEYTDVIPPWLQGCYRLTLSTGVSVHQFDQFIVRLELPITPNSGTYLNQ
ncbi:MAG: hypothetical protein JRE23_16165 [Deltaproteobacteria bacterium]|nr:hypothetical protein [Deltaproteobacteria bacterium]